jgi:thiol-disulfide isomerase/thioredoxin
MLQHGDVTIGTGRGAMKLLILSAAIWGLVGGAMSRAGEEPGAPMLLGKVQPEQILKISPDWKGNHDAADLAADAVERIRAAADKGKGEIRVEVVFGSWCSDSLDHVPRFVKLQEAVGPDRLPVTYVGVDRSKKDPGGLVASLKIEKVPTFIVFRKDGEIGRIVETPKTTVEGDLAEILAPPARP